MRLLFPTGATILLLLNGTLLADETVDMGSAGRLFRISTPDVAMVDSPTYLGECGSCHFAYQPGLLPARSWAKIMDNLGNHFGDNAELSISDQQAIRDYLMDNAADYSTHRRSIKIAKELQPTEIPSSISSMPYFIKLHLDLPKAWVTDNPRVGSYSKCPLCHPRAEKGFYEELDINVPGYGLWEK